MAASPIDVLQIVIAALQEAPALVAAGQTALTLLREQRDPTAEEQAALDAALDAAVKATPET